jgi:hypothetical protein
MLNYASTGLPKFAEYILAENFLDVNWASNADFTQTFKIEV